jgi:hypothetical protein
VLHARGGRGVGGGPVAGQDDVVLGVSGGDEDQDVGAREALGEGPGIVEVDAARGDAVAFARARDDFDIADAVQAVENEAAESARYAGHENHGEGSLPCRVPSAVRLSARERGIRKEALRCLPRTQR